MSVHTHTGRPGDTAPHGRNVVAIAGGLMAGGLLLNIVSTLAHPSGEEDDHEAIFTKYAESDPWVAVHLGQFVGVSLALGGLLALSLAMRAGGRTPLVSHFAAAATVATGAVWAVLQGLDGVGLKEAVDAWRGASGAERQTHFATAESIRWLEWGFQSYFRLLLGLAFALVGAAILRSGAVRAWLGWAALLAGLCSVVIGVDVGYSGLASGLQDAVSLAFLVVALAFAFGVIADGMRRGREQLAATAQHP